MKICFIGPASSAHIAKWCDWFSGKGHEVHVISFTPGGILKANVHVIGLDVDTNGSDIGKLKYLTAGKQIKRIIEIIKPDIVSVHYATSYGVAAAMSGIKRYVLSVWGSDIYDFPRKSPLHRVLLKYSLWKAPYLFSTSRAMALEATKYTNKDIYITPFGVDMELFNPNKRSRAYDIDGIIRIGIVKALTSKYGIDCLIKAFALFTNSYSSARLDIAGKGECEKEYKELAKKLNVDNLITWHGFVSQEEAARIWANLDIAVIPSVLESESFGVSAVEAQACGTPVIISDIPGLMEATNQGETSSVFKRGSEQELMIVMENLIDNPKKREDMRKKGRQFVVDNYEIDDCFKKIENYLVKISNGQL